LLRSTAEEKRITTSPKNPKFDQKKERHPFPQRNTASLSVSTFLVCPRGLAPVVGSSILPPDKTGVFKLHSLLPDLRKGNRWEYFSSSTAAEAVSGLPPFSQLSIKALVVATSVIPESDDVPEQGRGSNFHLRESKASDT
jgi:hypothetical protein